MTPAEQAFRSGLYSTARLPVIRDTGAVQRGNPLPVGAYWVDTFDLPSGDQRETFAAWLTKNRGTVALVAEEHYPGTLDGKPARAWFLFKVTASPGPFWEGPGFPTIAEPGVSTSDDTVEKAPEGSQSWSEILGFDGASFARELWAGGPTLKTAILLTGAAIGALFLVRIIPTKATE